MSIEEVPWDLIIAFIALALSLMGIYYTHRSVRSPSVLEARRQHSAELRGFLGRWLDEIPPPVSSNVLETHDRPLDFPQIENDWMYRDLMRHHLPAIHKSLPNEWKEYRGMTRKYSVCRHSLFRIIRDLTSERSGLEYDPYWKHKGISKQFVTMVYQQWMSRIERGEPCFDVKDLRTKDKGTELWISGNGLVKGTEDERAQGEMVFREMMLQDGVVKEHAKDIQKIIDKKRELDTLYKRVIARLKRLMGYPLLPGTKCEMLRSA